MVSYKMVSLTPQCDQIDHGYHLSNISDHKHMGPVHFEGQTYFWQIFAKITRGGGGGNGGLPAKLLFFLLLTALSKC